MKKNSLVLTAASILSFVVVLPASALAQDSTTPPPSPPPPVTARSGAGAGLGLGAVQFLSGLTGVQVAYDKAVWHVEGMFAFNSVTGVGMGDDTVTTLQFGARGWYHLHDGSNSDFSLGGGAGVVTVSGPGDDPTAFVLEPGALARVFLTPNFAFHGTLGLTMRFGDNVGPTFTGFGMSAQILSGLGITYFFR